MHTASLKVQLSSRYRGKQPTELSNAKYTPGYTINICGQTFMDIIVTRAGGGNSQQNQGSVLAEGNGPTCPLSSGQSAQD